MWRVQLLSMQIFIFSSPSISKQHFKRANLTTFYINFEKNKKTSKDVLRCFVSFFFRYLIEIKRLVKKVNIILIKKIIEG